MYVCSTILVLREVFFMKGRITVSIDAEVIAKAEEKGINKSLICEQALRLALDQKLDGESFVLEQLKNTLKDLKQIRDRDNGETLKRTAMDIRGNFGSMTNLTEKLRYYKALYTEARNRLIRDELGIKEKESTKEKEHIRKPAESFLK